MLKTSTGKPTSAAAPATRRGADPAARERPVAGTLAFPVSTHAGGGAAASAAPPPPPAPTPRPVLRRRRADGDEQHGTCPQCAAALATEAATGVRASLCPTCEAERAAKESGVQRSRAGGGPSNGVPRPASRPSDGGAPSPSTSATPSTPPTPASASGGTGGPPLVPSGGGRALDPGTRAFFEARLGRDLGAVRVHTGAAADTAARSVNAVAFTLGRDVVFREDRFSPATGDGRRLLAHELAHVAQQGFAPESPASPASSGDHAPGPAPGGRDATAAGPASPGGGAVQRAAEGGTDEAADERQARAVGSRVADGHAAGDLLAGTALRAPAVRREEGEPVTDEPIPLTFGRDRFEATLRVRESGGSPSVIIALRYVGGLPNDLAGEVVEMEAPVGPLRLAPRRLPGVENELVVDLYGDRSIVLRVEDTIRFEAGPPAARMHDLTMRRAGRFADSPMNFRIFDPTATAADTREFRPREMAGLAPRTRVDGGETVLRFDGDGDGYQELEARVDYVLRPTPDQQAVMGGGSEGQAVLWVAHRSDPGNNAGAIFRFPAPPASEDVRVRPSVERRTDGTEPTRIALTDPVGGRAVDVHPPVRTATEVAYDAEGGGRRTTLRFPPDREPPARHMTADGGRVMGKNAFWDVAIGPYGDRFRVTVDRGSEARPVLGIAPLSLGEPAGGRGAVLSFSGPLAGIRLLTQDPVTLSLDLDGDGRPDLRISDRIEHAADAPADSTPEGDRDHQFSVTGPALPGGLRFTVRYREGRLNNQFWPESDADRTAAASLQATAALAATSETDVGRRTHTYTDAFSTYRLRAKEQGWISQRMFDAWFALSADMTGVELQAPSGRVDPALATRAAGHARTLFDAMEAETSLQPSGGPVWTNPYTGASAGGYRGYSFRTRGQNATIPDDLLAGRWGEASSKFRALTDGMDRLVVDRATAAGDRDAEQMRGLAAMGSELRKLAGRNAVRIPAVFVPASKFKDEPGFRERIPLELYHWKDGTTWRMVDLTNPTRPFRDAVDERATPADSVHALMLELNNKDHFPEGRVYYDFPSPSLTGQVAVTDDLTWKDFFTWLGIGLAVVGVTLATAGSGTVAVAGMYLLAGSAVAGATAATIDLVEGARHGTLTAGQVVLDLAQIVGAVAGVGAMAAGRVLSVTRGMAAASAPATGARWARAAELAQRAVIPMAATNLAADAVTLAVIIAQGIEQLDAIDRSDAPAEVKAQARLRVLGQLAVTGGLTALSLRGNVAEITLGRSIEVVNVAGEPVVVPVGTSFAGRAIERSATELAAAAPAGRAAAEASHLDAIRRAVGGTGGEALARVEGMAMARAAGTGGAVVADAAGAVAAGGSYRTLREMVEDVGRANNAARAHGTPTEYVLEMRPGAAPGTTEAVVVSRPRTAASAASSGHLYVDVPGRAALETAQVTRVRAAAGVLPFRAEVLPDGLVRVNGMVDVHPRRLAEISDTDLRHLVNATRELEAAGSWAALQARNADAAKVIKRFVSSDPEVDATRIPERGYRLRFPHNRQEAMDNLDRLLADVGTNRGAHKAFRSISLTDQERLYDLVTASVPGNKRNPRTQATRYALDQGPEDVRGFVEHYEFYMAEFTARIQAETRVRLAGTGRPKLADKAKKKLYDDIEAQMSSAADPRVADATVAADTAKLYGDMVKQLGTRVGKGSITPRLSDLDAVRAVQAMDDVQFGSASAAVYHVRKHFAELPDAHQTLRADPVQSYLDSALQTIRRADPAATALRRNTSQYGTGRSFAFEHEGRRAIVVVTNEGRVILATYP